HTTLLFSTDTPPTELYTLSLHDALPILVRLDAVLAGAVVFAFVRVAATLVYVARTFRFTLRFDRVLFTRQLSYAGPFGLNCLVKDRKSTRLNSSHRTISYAVFCLKKKKK